MLGAKYETTSTNPSKISFGGGSPTPVNSKSTKSLRHSGHNDN